MLRRRLFLLAPQTAWVNFLIVVTLAMDGLHERGCTTGNAATVGHSTKKTTSGKDSVIEGQPLLVHGW
jgi:hypothetical protein